MGRITSQRGSVHMIVIAILVIALSASLGVLFYQNFIAKPIKTTTNETSSQQHPADTTDTALIAYDSKVYAFDHLKNWIVAKDTSASESSLTITNPDKTVQARIVLSQASSSDPCITTDNLKLRYYTVHQNPITDLTAEKQFIVEAVTDADGGGYNYAIGLAPDGGETHAALGDSRCTVKNVGLAAVYLPSSDTKAPTIHANIMLLKLTDDTKKVKSIEAVTDMLHTDDYKAALAILESGRQK